MDTFVLDQYFLNHRFDQAEVAWQTAELARTGFQGILGHARPGMLTPFMSADWWQTIDTILDVCRRTGSEFWIWDEDYFPSGLAGGRILWEDPGLAARELFFTETVVSGAGPFEVDFAKGMLLGAFAYPIRPDGTHGSEIDLQPFCGTRRQESAWSSGYILHRAYSPMISKVGHPHWRSGIDTNRFAVTWTPPAPGDYRIVGVVAGAGFDDAHPDLLRPEGIQRFLELCYDPYFARYGSDFGTLIKGAFTDEPSPGAMFFPWTARFPDEFSADHGYDLLPLLAHIGVDIDERTPMVRHHYRQTQQRLQCTYYVDALARWCKEHGIVSSGHLTRTEWLSIVAAWWPNELRCYRSMEIPCADPLGASEGWPDAAAYHTGLKVVSSAAHLFGRRQAGTDSFAVIGDEAGLRDLKYLLDHQLAMGINFFVIHGSSYSLVGPRKDEVPPSLFYQHTEWQQMPAFFTYLKDTCAQLTDGEHLCELAVLYPSTSLACQINAAQGNANFDLPDETRVHQLAETLLSHQRDFDLIDEVTLQEYVADDGELTTPERYRTILLPHLGYIDDGTARALQRFAAAGGRVIAIGKMPVALTRDAANPQREWADAAIELAPDLTAEILGTLPGVEVAGEGAHDIFVLRRRKDDGLYTFIFNRREAAFTGVVDGAAVSIPPRGSLLLTPSQPTQPDLAPKETVADLSAALTAAFPQNHIPLSYWHYADLATDEAGDPFHISRDVDMIRREADPAGAGDGPVRYFCRIMLSGEIPDAEIVIEDGGIQGEWQLCVNDVPIEGWQRVRKPDVLNLSAPVGHALRTGTAPRLNVVSIDTRGSGRGLKEMPYLYGHFTAEYRHGHLSFPFLHGADPVQQMPVLLPWNAIGYPTFSGTVEYRAAIDIPSGDGLALDLGRVEDVAEVSVDGRKVATLPWPPYLCRLEGVAPGRHELVVAVTNPPGNRNRNSGRPAGLLGPVRLVRV